MTSIREPVAREIARIIASRMVMSASTSFFGYGLQALVIKDYTSQGALLLWLLSLLVFEIGNRTLASRARKHLQDPVQRRSYLRLQLFGALLSGCCWGLSSCLPDLWLQPLAMFCNLFILVLVGIFAIHNMCLRWEILAAFSLGLLAPTVYICLGQSDEHANLVILAAVVAFGMVQVYGYFSRRLHMQQIIDQFEMQRLTEELKKKNLELTHMVEVVERLASHDPLTNCLNRRSLSQKYSAIGKRRQDGAVQLGLIMVDADHFKSINDQHGHEAGDLVLVEMVRRINAQLRSADSLARWGGEEFLCVLADVDQAGLQATAERIRQAIAGQPVEHRSGPLHITASLGVALMHGQESFEEAVNRADQSLYRAKRAGRNQVF